MSVFVPVVQWAFYGLWGKRTGFTDGEMINVEIGVRSGGIILNDSMEYTLNEKDSSRLDLV